MKTRNILFGISIALTLFLALSLVSAVRVVNYNADSAVIENNGTLNTTVNAVNGFDVSVYTCAVADCSTVGALVTTSTTGSNIIAVTFPTALQSQYGYALYFYKAGYIGFERVNEIISGVNNTPITCPFPVYLSQKRTGFAPIMNLSVAEEILTGRPIRIGFNVSIDADSYAAIQDSRTSNIPLNENVQTLVTLEIRNATNGLVYSANQTVNIPYSSYIPINFDYAGFSNTGAYNVNVFTDVTDAKILTSIRQHANSGINVIPQNLTNYSFTLIQNLNMAPALPVQGDNVAFSFNYNSGFVNDSDFLFPANTTLNMTIYKDAAQIWNSIVNAGSSGNYNFNRTFSDTGSYLIVVAGSPNDARGNLTVPSSQEITFIISASGPIPTPEPEHHTTTSSQTAKPDNIPLDSGLLVNGTGVINLSKPKEKGVSYALVYWLLALSILLAILITVIYAMKRR